MRIIKSMWLGLLFLPMLANATVTQVTLWQPEPGKTMQMLQVATEAKAMHAKLGAQADMAIDAMGRLHFIMAFEDWETWGAYRAKMAASAEMQAFVSRSATEIMPALAQLSTMAPINCPGCLSSSSRLSQAT